MFWPNLSFLQPLPNAAQDAYSDHVDSGLLQVAAPPSNIYPAVDYAKIHRTYSLRPGMARWRTKLVLDFAFLFSYCESLSKFFLLLGGYSTLG